MEAPGITIPEEEIQEPVARKNQCTPIGKSPRQPTRSRRMTSHGGGVQITTKAKAYTCATSPKIMRSGKSRSQALNADTPMPNDWSGSQQAKNGSLE